MILAVKAELDECRRMAEPMNPYRSPESAGVSIESYAVALLIHLLTYNQVDTQRMGLELDHGDGRFDPEYYANACAIVADIPGISVVFPVLF